MLSIQDISLRLSESYALKNISMHVAEGERLFILGSSGSGKSTLLKIICGFLTQDSGKIIYNNKDISLLPARERKIILMFQSYALWPHLTVVEHLQFALSVYSKDLSAAEKKQRTQETLQAVGLESLLHRFPHQLSGGQQQRVALARALVVRPKLLLLDEPFSNLDEHLRSSIAAELRELQKLYQLTCIHVSHDAKLALAEADRIGIMEQGRLIQLDTPQEVLHNPKTETTARLLGITPPNLTESL